MKRILVALGAAGVIALLAVAAPAISARPYVPDVVEFEIPAPEPVLGSSTGDSGFVSQPVRAPRRFNLVGLRWEGDSTPAIAVRVRGEGEHWGPWTPVPAVPDGGPDPGTSDAAGTARNGPASQPVWAGQADYVQYRMSERPSDLRLHFINTTGTASAGDRIENAVRGTVNHGVISLAGLLASARAGSGTPDLVERKKWDPKNDCKPRRKPDKAKIEAAFIHHTVNANNYDKKESRSMVLAICRYHRNVNGWDDIGYNFVTDRFGTLFEGRDPSRKKAVAGAHTVGFNAQSTGVANLGTFSKVRQPKDALKAQGELIKWLSKEYDFPVDGKVKLESGGGSGNRYDKGEKPKLKRISGHRDAASTECPGSELYQQLGKIRKYAD